jgi:hypothetical protein
MHHGAQQAFDFLGAEIGGKHFKRRSVAEAAVWGVQPFGNSGIGAEYLTGQRTDADEPVETLRFHRGEALMRLFTVRNGAQHKLEAFDNSGFGEAKDCGNFSEGAARKPALKRLNLLGQGPG